MCTMIILHGILPSHPVVIASNRDEFLSRPSRDPHGWIVTRGGGRPVRVFAGRDEKEGGTWLGVNEFGLVAGITNLYTGERDPRKASRGGLVSRCLAARNLPEAERAVDPEEVTRYNPFNLFCLSPEAGGFVLSSFPRLRRHPLGPGIHILTNRGFGDPDDPKRAWILSHLDPLPTDGKALIDLLVQILGFHGEGEGAPPVCVHLPGYGTVSSSLLLLGRNPRESRYLYAPGPPCRVRYRDLTGPLLSTLLPGTGL